MNRQVVHTKHHLFYDGIHIKILSTSVIKIKKRLIWSHGYGIG